LTLTSKPETSNPKRIIKTTDLTDLTDNLPAREISLGFNRFGGEGIIYEHGLRFYYEHGLRIYYEHGLHGLNGFIFITNYHK